MQLNSPISASALSLKGLTKTYQRSHLGRVQTTRGVNDIHLEVHSGEIFGLLGPNGSGKTTLIKCILGLLFPTSGAVEINGQPTLNPETKKQIGYLPEVPYFYKTLSGREVLHFYGRLSGLPAQELAPRVERALQRVRMQEQAHRRMKEYSKGMLQRIGLAQAILHDPSILIFDEPVTGLDPIGMKEMRELMLDLNREGKTIFFSSHSIAEAEKVCHRAAILVNGRLKKVLTQADWQTGPDNLETQFIRAAAEEGVLGVA